MKEAGKIETALRLFSRPLNKEIVFFIVVNLMLIHQPINWICIANDDWGHNIFSFVQGLFVECGVVYAATSLIYWSRSKIVKSLMYALFWFLLVVTVFLEFNFNQNISQQPLTILAETNPKESGEFVNTYMLSTESLWGYAIDFVALVVILLAEWKSAIIKRFIGRVLCFRGRDVIAGSVAIVGLIWSIVCYVILFSASNTEQLYTWRHYFPHNSMDPFTQTMHGLNSLRDSANDTEIAIKTTLDVSSTQATVTEGDSLTVIYILGESYNKHHASIYGYPLPTTPNFEREVKSGNLFVFNDAVNTENYTSFMEKNIFSLNSIGAGEHWFDYPSFATVFKHAGYDVWMWDMQRDFMTKRLYTITVNAYLYNDEMKKLSYTACNEKRYGYDGGLVTSFFREKTPGKYNLVILHFMGQHIAYFQRFPKSETVFTADDIQRTDKYLNKNKKGIIAQYDNATRYNDAVMKQVFDHYRNKNAVLLYMSDHGEEIYDYRDYRGRQVSYKPTPGQLRNQNETPFLVWCSDAYKKSHPDIVKRLQSSLDRPFMTDIVGHTLLALGQVKTPYYKAEHDVTSPQFKPVKRKVYGHYYYEDIMSAEKK